MVALFNLRPILIHMKQILTPCKMGEFLEECRFGNCSSSEEYITCLTFLNLSDFLSSGKIMV